MHAGHRQSRRRDPLWGAVALPSSKAFWLSYALPLLCLVAVIAYHYAMLVYTAHRLPLLPLVLPIALAATLGGAPPAMLMTFLGGLLLSTNFLGLSRWDRS